MADNQATEEEIFDLALYKRNKFVNDSIAEKIDYTTDKVVTTQLTDKFRADIGNYWIWNKSVQQEAGGYQQLVAVGQDDEILEFNQNIPLEIGATPEISVDGSKEKILTFNSSELGPGAKVSLKKLGSVELDEGMAGWFTDIYAVKLSPGNSIVANYNNEQAGGPPDWWTKWCYSKFGNAAINKDMPFSTETPEVSGENINLGGEITRNFVKIRGNYNYFKKDYENFINGISEKYPQNVVHLLPETILPNLYTYMSVVENNTSLMDANTTTTPGMMMTQIEQSKFNKHLTLDGTMKNLDIESLFFIKPKDGQAPSKLNDTIFLANSTISNYYNLWTKTIGKAEPEWLESQGASISLPYEKIIFPQADFEIINNYNGAASSFPMNVQVEIETEQNKAVFRALKDTNYNSYMMDYLTDTNQESVATFLASNGTTTSENLGWAVWHFNDFLGQAQMGTLAPGDDSIYVGSKTNNVIFNTPSNKFFAKLMSLGLKAKINSLIKSTFRDFEQILSGGECYAETVMYEVEKWSSNKEGKVIDKLQSFYLPNDNNKIIEFFDTQVRYNKFYVYRIFAYKIVFGASYSYDLHEEWIFDEAYQEGKSAMISVHILPDLKIIKTPYYNVDEFFGKIAALEAGDIQDTTAHLTTVVMDDAPLPPEVEIVPVIKEPRNIIINLKDTIGSFSQKPRLIDETDIGQYEVLLDKQLQDKFNLTKEALATVDVMANEIFFKSDDPSQTLEVFQLFSKPTTYQDFQQAEKKSLIGPNNSVKIKLNFNQKNYFVFRAIDFHNKFSNPTDVYEVEIRESDGLSFPIIRIFNIEEENKNQRLESKKFARQGKRFIHVQPAYNQWMMAEKYAENEYESAFDIADFSIGEADESVFQENRRFKIRITSKKTGRKIDVNLKLKLKQETVLVK